ncbi:Histidine kinase-like ATPase domain-containing protein [Streptomyces sp. DvalAA-14]|nr:Histidine kinase-like ATPase domain-containing protein [Streptomyces sp. DvalAA-14]
MHSSEVFTGEPGAIAAARRSVTAFLTRARSSGLQPAVTAETLDAAALVVSELVTNAIRHAGGPCGLDLRIEQTAVEITVRDTSPHRPAVSPQDPTRVGAHGLEIVIALCGGFRTRLTPTGKQITARLPLT